MSALEQTWCRLLARRVEACIDRYRTTIATVEDRMSSAAWDRGAWVSRGAPTAVIERALDDWIQFRAIDAPPRLEQLRANLAITEADQASLVVGVLPSGYELFLPDRRTHCRPASCGLPRRRHIGLAELRRYPLTQPPHICQACGYEAEPGQNLELDHLAELVFGGADHAFNLIRVCSECHRAKPIWPDETPGVQRILALEFYGVAA